MSSIKWQGQIDGHDPDFVTFDTPQDGIRAMTKILISYQKNDRCLTIRQIISRWAPPEENDTNSYVLAVGQSVNWPVDTPIDLLHDRQRMVNFVKAIITHENGQQPYDSTLVANAVSSAFEGVSV